MTLYFAASLIVEKNNSISFYPFGVEANTLEEAIGKAHRVSYKLNPNASQVHVKVNDGDSPIVRDVESVYLGRMENGKCEPV
jgi:hypothetical protein